jgi:phosphoketolase
LGATPFGFAKLAWESSGNVPPVETRRFREELAMPNVLSEKECALIDAYWRAANYLSVGQIYLFDNPLLKVPLTKDHIKPRLLGHWGTTPGLNLIYAHLNRLIKKRDLDMIYITGPGHGGPGLVANAYLEGTYSEVYPNISQDEEGMKRLFTQFSFPGGIPSHVAPETPGSMHEGGELSIRRLMGQCCRSYISTATRSPIPQCSRASRTRSSTISCAATAMRLISSRATSLRRCTS